ncbi:MAG: lamin tail domain-containing protein, partial [Anaerolineales bacterium]|nr:lamin tail domain-containing protein [Anaerolineales bacterium]
MMKKNQFWHPMILFVILLLVGCRDNQEIVATPDADPTAKATETVVAPTATAPIDEPVMPIQEEGILFSELLPGMPGNNNREFIELYNAGVTPVDLAGWSLWYKLNDSQDAVLVYKWTAASEIPGWGHFLLLRADQPFEVIGDAVYDTPLFERRGGLVLRDANDEVVDRLGWGEGIGEFFAGGPAGVPVDGASIERLPGGASGNGVNSNDNASDFALSAIPSPQNSGSARTPLPDERLVVTATAPEVVEPGTSFSYTIEVQNFSDAQQHDLVVTIPLSADFELLSGVGEGVEVVNGRYIWQIPQLEPEETVGLVLELQSPFTYLDTIASGVKVEAEGMMTAFAAPRPLSVAGGAIPIAAARGLAGNVVTIEGVATMYTGGFFAGSTGTKFYMEDETGGVQIYVPGGNSVVNVAIGDRVRVTGGVEIYRDSVEVVPIDIEADVEVMSNEGSPEPAVITAADNETNDAVLGKLNRIEGMATRIEEFSFSYELDIVDETGTTTLVYIEKDTGMTAELLEPGKLYRVTGISEFYSSQRQLKPRLQSDIAEVFPPELLLSVGGLNSAGPGDVVVFEITAVNHT